MVNLTARGKRVAGVSLQRTANQLMLLISHHVPHTGGGESPQNEKRLHCQQKQTKDTLDPT